MSASLSSGISFAKGTPLDFQPLDCTVVPEEDCGCEDLDWCQPVLISEDNLSFQFKAPLQDGIIADEELNTQAEFNGWFSEGWTWATDLNTGATGACHVVGTTTPLAKIGDLTTGAKYKIVIKVFNMTAGSLSLIADPVNAITANGEYTFFVTALGTILQLDPSVDFDGCVDYVRVWQVSEDFTVETIDSDGNVVSTVGALDINQYGEDVIVSVPWANLGLTAGNCYTIRVTDDNPIIQDQFDIGNLLGWTLVPDITIDGTLHYVSAAVGIDYAILENVLEAGCEYQIDYDFDLDPIAAANVRAVAGTVEGALRVVAGSYSETIVADGPNLSFKFTSPAAGDGWVDNLVVTKISSSYESRCIALQSATECDLKFKWNNDENAFAHNYEDDTTFFHELRLCGKLRIGTYPSENVMDVNSAGAKARSYADYRKGKVLQLQPVPEYIHDALVSMMNHDNWFIDNVEYVLEGDYETEDNNDSDLFGAVIEIELADQPNQKNFNC